MANFNDDHNRIESEINEMLKEREKGVTKNNIPNTSHQNRKSNSGLLIMGIIFLIIFIWIICSLIKSIKLQQQLGVDFRNQTSTITTSTL